MDQEDLNELLCSTVGYLLEQGVSRNEAYNLAIDWVYNETDNVSPGSNGWARLETAKRANGSFTVQPSGRSSRRRTGRFTRSSLQDRYEESTRGPSQRYTDEPTRETHSGTEYGRMFQNGGDRNAARTSGKILSEEEISGKYHDIYHNLLANGANLDYARQKAEQFNIREMGKRNNAAQGTNDARSQSARSEYGSRDYPFRFHDDEAYDEEPPRRSHASCGGLREYYRAAGASTACNTFRTYTKDELKDIMKDIFEEWVEKGVHPDEARQEAKKWFRRYYDKHDSSSRPSGFDNFSNMRDALDNDEGYRRRPSGSARSGSTHSPRAGTRPSGWDNPMFDQHLTDEPDSAYSSSRRQSSYDKEDNISRFRSRRKRSGTKDSGHSYRTEERRPGSSPPPEYSGVNPSENLYVILGVSNVATAEEIKAARRKLCFKHHPERVKGGPAVKKVATEKMAMINQACGILIDKKMRAFYDQTGLIASLRDTPDAH